MDERFLESAARQVENEQAVALAAQLAAPDPYAGPQLFDPETNAVLCWECEEPIPVERLAAKPTAAFCAPCQTRLEKRR